MAENIITDKALVSVNMPVYNGERFLKQAIESILNQTYENWELIIINDCSTDNSLEIINRYNDPRIKIYSNETNKGIGFSRNKAIKHSSGKYIAILDCDDVMLENRLHEQVLFLEKKPAYKMVGSWVELINLNGESTGNSWQYTLNDELINTELFFNNYFTQSAIMVEKSVAENFLYNERLAPAEDYMLWCQIAEKYAVHTIQKVLVKYRVHDTSISHTAKAVQNNAVKEIITYNLRRLQLENLSKNEIELHINLLISNKEYIIANKLSEQALLWLYKLKVQNEKKYIFHRKHFNLKLKRIWNSYFNIETSYKWGLNSIKYLFLGVNNQYNIKMKTLFIYKAIRHALKNR